MKKYKKTITVYEFSDGFIVERDQKKDCIEFYISHKKYGEKSLMFGLCNRDERAAEEMMLSELEFHIDCYKETYFDYDDMDNEDTTESCCDILLYSFG